VALDVGRGAPELEGCARIFLTHGHLDHVLGLPFLLSRRAAADASETTVHAPVEIAEPLAGFVAAAERLEERRYVWRLEALRPGDAVGVDPAHTIRAFAVDHGVPGLGYLLERRRRRLRADLRELPAPALAAARRRGESIDEETDEPWLAYCGDTGPALFEREPWLYDVPVLVVECTFLDAERRDHAARYRHLHIDDLAARAGEFRNRTIVLVHLSRRHRPEELRRLIDERLPAIAERVRVWGEPA
jgi:ribonuclease Z